MRVHTDNDAFPCSIEACASCGRDPAACAGKHECNAKIGALISLHRLEQYVYVVSAAVHQGILDT